jgi:uracil-DNA glycosylase
MHNTWSTWLTSIRKPEHNNLLEWIAQQERQGRVVYPEKQNRLKVFEQDPENVKVVIVGQDPYHGPGQAIGLSFAVAPGIALPPSLRNMYTELKDDIPECTVNALNGDLTPWHQQGVMLLNSVLTVEASTPNAHQGKGWEDVTNEAISKLAANTTNKVFILWGNYAAKKSALIKGDHLILTAPHPSPLSSYRGFFGSKPFSKANTYLIEKGIKPINWSIT